MPLWNVRSAGFATPTGNRISLAPGATFLLPDGVYEVHPGHYACVQYLDPQLQAWTKIGGGYGSIGGNQMVFADGLNFRLANQTGSAVGALLTNAGSGYTSAPTVTASAGASLWRAVVGGAVSTTVTVTNGGLGYTYAPSVIFSSPAFGGVPASGYCTLTGAVVSSVTVTNQGAGYTQPPTITFVNDPRELLNPLITTGYNAAAVATLTGAGTVTAVICIDHGQGGLTSIPTLAFAGGGGSSAAATAIMCWSITAYTVTTAGAGFTTAPYVTGYDNFPTTAPAYTNPSTQAGLVATADARIIGAVSAGALTATGQNVLFGGIYTSTPTLVMQTTGLLITTTGLLAATMGGQAATVYAQQV